MLSAMSDRDQHAQMMRKIDAHLRRAFEGDEDEGLPDRFKVLLEKLRKNPSGPNADDDE